MKAFILFILVSFLSLHINSQTVFKTPSGEKYHLASCRMVKNVSEEISTAKAIALGLTACKICKPANIYGNNLNPYNKAKGENNSVQCNGLTKKGTRCKHLTKIANGYCYQHQPE